MQHFKQIITLFFKKSHYQIINFINQIFFLYIIFCLESYLLKNLIMTFQTKLFQILLLYFIKTEVINLIYSRRTNRYNANHDSPKSYTQQNQSKRICQIYQNSLYLNISKSYIFNRPYRVKISINIKIIYRNWQKIKIDKNIRTNNKKKKYNIFIIYKI